MAEHLNENERGEVLNNSSDNDEEETLTAKLFQEIEVASLPGIGRSVLGVTWSSAGNTLAVSIGQPRQNKFCNYRGGLIRIYTVKRAEHDKLVHTLDISEKNCISAVQYHPSATGLLAYGNSSGEVVLCNLKNFGYDEGIQLSSPLGCHGSKLVTALLWADATLAKTFLTMEINKTGKRRRASDEVLVSVGSDGTVNVWCVNNHFKIFHNMICYKINSSPLHPPSLTCIDFIKTSPLRKSDEKVSDDIFVVGTTTGRLYLCKIKKSNPEQHADVMNPVYETLNGHPTCIIGVVFSVQRPGVFVSVSIDSELRFYDVNQSIPLKVVRLENPASCMSWLPNNPCIVFLGQTDAGGDGVKVHNVRTGRAVPVQGLTGGEGVTSIAVFHKGNSRIATGDSKGCVRIWDVPTRRIKLTPVDMEF